MINEYVPNGVLPDDYYSVISITLGELIECKVIDWEDPSWDFECYNEEQKKRLIKKIEGRYWNREISITPPGLWKMRFISLMSEIAPKYNKLYELNEKEYNVLADGDEYGKSRNIFSDFPATRLGGDNQDYASTATDNEYENVRVGNYVNNYTSYVEKYNDVDVLILNELEVLFSSLFTVSIGGF